MLDFGSFKKLSKKGNLVALNSSIPADLETPVSTFLKVAKKKRNAFLLESAEYAESIGRYSVIGVDPQKIYVDHGRKIEILSGNQRKTLSSKQHLIDIIAQTMKGQKLANAHDVPGFCGGLVGFFSYENVQYFEDIRLKSLNGPQIPQGIFFLCNHFLVVDHYRKTLSAVVIVDVKSKKNLKNKYNAAQRHIEKQLKLVQSPLRTKKAGTRRTQKLKLQSNMTKRAFKDKVKKIKNYIRAGDCIQVVLSQRFSFPAKQDDFQIYRALRSINPSPYMFYFRCGKLRLIGSSPEVLVKKTARVAEVRPIAGTRPRGKDAVQDMANAENLKKSSKEMAEHLMLVDLGRNDLGRVCEFESVDVKNFARIERYSHVMHLVSDVTGKLKKGRNSFDLLKATFPAGTVTGAPKIRAMQIINELEPEKRGPYAGCLGYFSFNHDMDTCITIRTLIVDGKKIYLQAGAGIVKDSNPDREFDETVNKAKALVTALSVQEHY